MLFLTLKYNYDNYRRFFTARSVMYLYTCKVSFPFPVSHKPQLKYHVLRARRYKRLARRGSVASVLPYRSASTAIFSTGSVRGETGDAEYLLKIWKKFASAVIFLRARAPFFFYYSFSSRPPGIFSLPFRVSAFPDYPRVIIRRPAHAVNDSQTPQTFTPPTLTRLSW